MKETIASIMARLREAEPAEVQAMPSIFKGDYVPTVCKTEESRQAFLTKFSSKAKQLATFGKHLVLKSVKDGQRICFYAEADNDIHYFMRLNPLKVTIEIGIENFDLLPTSGVYQGSVWRNKLTIVPYGGRDLARTVFWKLQKPNRTLWSDISQSEDGMLFWHRRISEALELGLTVLAINFSPKSDEHAHVVKVLKITELDDALSYWTKETSDSSDIGLYWRFAII